MKRLIALACLSLVACGGGDQSEEATAESTAGDETTQDLGNAVAAEAPASDIVDTAVAAGSFSTLAAALEAAGLVDTLKGEGPFTVFAPTDDAFAALPPGTVETLLQPENRDQLTAILTYHVVSGDVRAADVASLSEATTVQGAAVAIDTSSGVMINDATVTQADVVCSNGVIHIIDKVLMPPTE
ncbi:MAG: fasciclin domain-containing protein [Myxococcota bacterium]